MTDKEKLERLRAEIVRRMDELYDKLPDGNQVINGAVTAPDANITGKYTALESILSFVDSMQGRSKDRCIGCNNVKGCVTCVDGSEWAHYREVSCVSSRAEPEGEDYGKALNSEAAVFLQEQQVVPNLYSDMIIRAVKRGAQWERRRMMKAGVDARISFGLIGSFVDISNQEEWEDLMDRFETGDKVKLIIIKED